MTATLPVVTAAPSVTAPATGWLTRPRLFAGVGSADLTRYDEHLRVHGPLPVPDLTRLLAELESVALTGRGGAAFPLARKLRSLRQGAVPLVVVNATEGEPASRKDEALLALAPHLVLDGAAAVARAVGADRVRVALTDPVAARVVTAAVHSRPDAARFTVEVVPDRFLIGESQALVSALSGGRGVPDGRRTLPTVRGVSGRPTVLSNAETWAQVAVLLRMGAVSYAEAGTPAEPGTTLLTVSGAVSRPGVLEVAIGTTLGQVADAVGALPSQAVIIGGYHGAWLRADPALALSRAAVSAAGGTLGAGAVIFVGAETCALGELARITRWLADQSARQCGPCTFGLPALAEDVSLIAAGVGDPGLVARHAALVTGRGACAHPDGAARFVRTGLAVLAEDARAHRSQGHCRRRDLGHLTGGTR